MNLFFYAMSLFDRAAVRGSRLFAAGIIAGMTVFGPVAADADGENHAALPPLSKQTQECLDCHETYHPGLVADWRGSRHARITVEEAMKKGELERRVSSPTVPDSLKTNAVGCFECHSLNAEQHKDNFQHFKFKINVVVSPNDCKTCHATEAEQFAGSKKAHAIANLRDNPVYHGMVNHLTGVKEFKDGKMTAHPASPGTENETCYGCHGTKVEVHGLHSVSTDVGDIMVPVLSNWPNQGVGRGNPDGSVGACTACHPRHGFSIEIARKPHTCSQCHLEPDVPAWDVYRESKHGNIWQSKERDWDWNAVPWKAGKDFTAPTCAACHNALIASPEGDELAARTHDFGARLWVRIFGLPYSHPQPKNGNTSLIKNKDGLPLPTTFAGEPASEFLIDAKEQAARKAAMTSVCQACHGQNWIRGHFAKLDQTLAETDKMVLAATHLWQQAQKAGVLKTENPFDEKLDHLWMKQWLFYANSVRYASAMSGPDFASFKNGWWELTRNLEEIREAAEGKKPEVK